MYVCVWTVSSVRGIFQARMLEWVALSYSRESSNPGIKPASLVSPTLANGFFATVLTGNPKLTIKLDFFLDVFPIHLVTFFSLHLLAFFSLKMSSDRPTSLQNVSMFQNDSSTTDFYLYLSQF